MCIYIHIYIYFCLYIYTSGLPPLYINGPRQAERYYEAAALQEDLEALTAGRADITQEEGSYDPFRTLPP